MLVEEEADVVDEAPEPEPEPDPEEPEPEPDPGPEEPVPELEPEDGEADADGEEPAAEEGPPDAGGEPEAEQPDLASISAGQATVSKSTLGWTLAVVHEQRGKREWMFLRRVVSALHPVPAESATSLQRRWHFRALVRGHAAVLRAPDRTRRLPFGGASVEDTETAAGHLYLKRQPRAALPPTRSIQGRETYGQIKLCRTNISTSVRRLHNHCLPFDRGARERQFIARAARRVAATDGRKAVSHVVIDGPWCLIGARVGGAALAAGLGIAVAEGLVAGVADFDGGGGAFPGPGARGFAAVPVASCCARGSARGGSEGSNESDQKGLLVSGHLGWKDLGGSEGRNKMRRYGTSLGICLEEGKLYVQ